MEQKKLMQHTHKYIHNIATLANWLFFWWFWGEGEGDGKEKGKYIDFFYL